VTLEQAVEILNARNHRGMKWDVIIDLARGGGGYDWLGTLGAVAVAEKYLRDDKATISSGKPSGYQAHQEFISSLTSEQREDLERVSLL
jgi:hypothetical protein